MATLNVGAGQAYTTLAAAVAASRNGDVIAVQAGTYVNDFATISTKITIVGVGGMANFVATVPPPNGKGILVTQTDVTIENLSFSGAAVADKNGAGIRYEGGNLTVVDSYFHDNQNGILANSNPSGTIRITGSEFAGNGAGDGQSHNIYVNNIAALIIDDSFFHDADTGHQIKSRAQSTTITNSRIYDGTGNGSYSIDLPNGGVAVIRDNVIEQGANSPNTAIVHYGGESAAYAGSSISISGNVVVNDLLDRPSAKLLSNATTVTATITGNEVYGLTADQIASGSATISGTTYLSTRPSLDTSAPWLDGGGTDAPAVTIDVDVSDSTPTQGQAVSAHVTAETGSLSGIALGYQWQMQDGGSWTNIAGATAASYTPGAGQAGHALRVLVTPGGAGSPTASDATEVTGRLFNGTGGADAPALTAGADNVLGGGGNDSLFGLAGADTLNGGAGADTLDGGSGADRLIGGGGDDYYVVDNAGDVVIEGANQGIDTIQSSLASHTLSANVEVLVTTRAAGATLTGNALDNRLIGAGGGDVLYGLAGADTLEGRGGADTLHGGAGDDLYVITGVEDTVIETANAGHDRVLVTGGDTYTLRANFEELQLGGTVARGAGNGLDNLIIGNASDNRLLGAAGADTLQGGAGKDVLIGGEGADVLHGGSGADVFLFNSVSDSTRAAPDLIQDFVAGEDRIRLLPIDANTHADGDQAFAWIGTANFSGVAGQLRATSDDAGTWLVQGDVDGDRVADLAIRVASPTAPSANWFIL